MDRLIIRKLLKWKRSNHRKPLMVRGTRQVGKTWSIVNFGDRYFPGNIHHIDLEKHPDWHTIFEQNLDVNRIINELEILTNKKIVPDEDLLFFDEIQSCPRAIMALRYFFEDMPELHVIAAGSLLEFALKDISFPVGRIQELHLFPMSFIEYLWAIGKQKTADILFAPPQKLSDSIHQMLLDELKNYIFIGGLPECVQRYTETMRLQESFQVQAELLNTFRQDFSKYAPYSDKTCINAVLTSIAKNVGQQTKYARLSDGYSNPTIKKAYELLLLAQLIRKVQCVNPPVVPLGASASEIRFKSLVTDMGLLQSLVNMSIKEEYYQSDLLSIYRGALAEQFVGQEFLAAGQNELFYWGRNAKNSTAEVDYILPIDSEVSPVEVKSGPSGKLKSLHQYFKNYPKCKNAYVLSSAPYAQLQEQKITFLPLYYAYSIAKPNTP